ncbi:MAG: hypothetical protein HY219_02795 [Candidatus Staskawiczbacteria bacterium]|nr:hypothetical protein [Candidatus Staskawiczbacteria bacterium]
MNTATLTIAIQPNPAKSKVTIEMDALSFERVAANFKLFNKEFIESLERAEKQITTKKLKKLRSLSDLR